MRAREFMLRSTSLDSRERFARRLTVELEEGSSSNMSNVVASASPSFGTWSSQIARAALRLPGRWQSEDVGRYLCGRVSWPSYVSVRGTDTRSFAILSKVRLC